jgi:hypothetical protein
MQQGRATANIHHFVQHYRVQQQQGKIPAGWQQTTSPDERGQLALQFFTQYRLLKPDIPEVESMRAALQFETQNFMSAQSKEQYLSQIKQKLIVMTTARQQQLQRLQGGIPNNMNNAMNGMTPAQMNMMGQMGQMGQQGARQPAPQQFNPAFPNAQLQRPMQVSPVPMAQGQSSMGGVNGANPANMAQGQNNQQPNMQPNQQQTRQEQLIINQFAKKLMDTCKEEVRVKFEADVRAWPEDKKQQLVNQGINPLFLRFRQHAEMLYRRGALNQPAAGQNNAAMQGTPQQNRMQGQQMNMNQRQPNQDFDFTEIANRQMEAMRSQDQGTTVVPASNNPNNGGQMGGFQGQNSQPSQAQNAMAQRQVEAFHRQAQAQQAHAQAQAQAQAQARLEQQRQQQAAQAARNQQNQLLQGQIGGLNLPQGTQQPSPAMPMLNRPMPPPGQPGPPGTPQQRPPQAHVPIMTPQPGQTDPNLTELMRQAQQRAAAVQQANQQPLTEQVRMSMMPPDLDASVKQQLLKVPEHQFRVILQSYMMNLRRNNGMPNGAFPPGQPNGGQPNMAFNQQQQQQLQPGVAGQMLGGPNMQAMVRPGMNLAQPPPGAGPQNPMGAQRGPMPNQQQRVAAASNLLRANPGIIHTTDPKPFPPNVLNAQIRQNLPPDVRTWQQLKAWASQNPALVPGVDSQKLLMLQVLHFQDMVRQSNGVAGVHPTPQPGQGLVAPGQINPNQVPIRTPQQQQPNMQNMAALQVTPQELQQFRARMAGQPQANLPDDQLRGLMISMRMKSLQQQRQQQQQQQQSAMLNQQAQRNQGQPAVPMTPQQQPPHQPNRPPAAQPPTQATPQPKPAMKPQQAQPAQSHPNNNVANKGTKRPHEDTVESGTEATPQAPAMASSKSQPGLNLTQEQMSKLTPTQHAQYRAQLLKAQDASNNKLQQQQRGAMLNPEELRQRMSDPTRIRQLKQMMDEVEKSIPPKQPISLPPPARAALQKSLKEQFQRLKQSDQALRIFHAWYDTNEPEPVIRQIMRSRALLLQQISDSDGTLHPQVTLTIDEFKNHLTTLVKFVIKIQEKVKQGQGSAAPQSQPQGSNASPAQLNAANLKIVEQQNRNQKAPSAPTTDRPPFAIGADPGHGAAHYFEGARPVTNLVLPEKKRAKLEAGSQTSTPTARASPHIGSGNSPELRRQQAPDKQVPQRPTFRCSDATCEYSVRGFDTQAELDSHSQIHAKVDNPMQFALDSMAEYLDVDQKTGEAKTDPNASKSTPKPAPAAPPRAPPQNIKTEQTPNALQNAATPVGQTATSSAMARVPTQTGVKDSPSSNLLKTPQTMTKVTTPGSGARGKATPASIPKSVPKEQQMAAPEPTVKEEEQQQQQHPMLPMSLLDYSYEDTFAALDANGPFTVLDLKDEDTAWALRSRPASPSTTPESSSKDTPSTRQSDISENDNLVISIDLKDADMPDAWAVGMYGDALPVDLQLSEDLQNLGVMLPPMDSEDMMLFPDYGAGTMMDLDMLEKTMDSMGGTLDASSMVGGV